MGRAVADVLPIAVAIALFPIPVIAVVLLVGSNRGTEKGVAFVAAWAAGLAVLGGVVLLVAGEADASESGDPSRWASVVLLLLGVVLLGAAVKGWLGRPRAGEEPPTPGWMRSIEGFTPLKAAAAGFALTVLNPKNVLLAAAAATEIAAVGLPVHEQAAALAIFVLLASAGVLAPLVYTVAAGERSRAPLEALRGWMARWNAVIVSVLCLLIGAKLIGEAIAGLAG